jgi:hypothetical protein
MPLLGAVGTWYSDGQILSAIASCTPADIEEQMLVQAKEIQPRIQRLKVVFY